LTIKIEKCLKTTVITAILTICALVPSFSANINVPTFELTTRGYMEGGAFKLNTRGNIDLLIEGGYKFGGSIGFELESDELEDDSIEKYLAFKSASVTVRNLFDLPLDLEYFTGDLDVFCSGNDFPLLFGTEPIASFLSGFYYFPTGIIYEGIHAINGTGFAFSSASVLPWLNLALYLYQDGHFDSPGNYSVDIRSMYNFEKFKMEAFVGASYGPTSLYGIYRSGLLLFYNTGVGGEFLTEIGIPRWDPVVDKELTIDLFYFLFEPRVRIYPLSIILTLFWHPQYYLQQETHELTSVDINANFLFGDIRKTQLSGGLEAFIGFRSQSETDQLLAKLTPYMSFNTSGVIWDVKVGTKLLPFELNELIEAYIGIRTQF
jgi:hypothetical protein